MPDRLILSEVRMKGGKMSMLSEVGLSEDTKEWPWVVCAPWTNKQVDALNAFQRYGPGHQREWCFSARHARREQGRDWRGPAMIATAEGWACPDPECGATHSSSSVYPITLARGTALIARLH